MIQLPSKNYAQADTRPKNRRDESLRFTDGRFGKRRRDLAGDGVAVADTGEHFPEGAENAFDGVLRRQKPLAILGRILIDAVCAS
jgi:hypothetical protein